VIGLLNGLSAMPGRLGAQRAVSVDLGDPAD
jgi:hypothetical protein